jgi:hypothetical protein
MSQMDNTPILEREVRKVLDNYIQDDQIKNWITRDILHVVYELEQKEMSDNWQGSGESPYEKLWDC